VNKLSYRPFNEALQDFNLVSEKDVDIRLIESILLSSRFLAVNPQMFQVELLSRFWRGAGANSAVVGRMVDEAALMVLLTTERLIVPFYPCVSVTSAAAVRRRTGYAPTHLLAVNTVQLPHHTERHQQRDDDETATETEETADEAEEEAEEEEEDKVEQKQEEG